MLNVEVLFERWVVNLQQDKRMPKKWWGMHQRRKFSKDAGSAAKCSGHWTCNLVVPSSSPLPCYPLVLFSVALSSTFWLHFVYSHLICYLPVGIFKLNGLVKSTRSNPNHGFVQAIGLKDSLLKVGLMKFPSTANFGLLDIVHKNKHSDKRFS